MDIDMTKVKLEEKIEAMECTIREQNRLLVENFDKIDKLEEKYKTATDMILNLLKERK